jgi:hypothetical protein
VLYRVKEDLVRRTPGGARTIVLVLESKILLREEHQIGFWLLKSALQRLFVFVVDALPHSWRFLSACLLLNRQRGLLSGNFEARISIIVQIVKCDALRQSRQRRP